MQEKLLTFLKKKSTLFIICITLFYHGVFNSYTGQLLFNNLKPGDHPELISGNIVYLSLFFGVEIENFSINAHKENPFIKVDTLRLKYNLPALLLGKVQISEISILKPVINLEKKDGKFNYETIFPKSKEEEKLTENSEDKTELPTYIPISFYGNFILDSLTFSYRDDENNEIKIHDFSITCEIQSKRFRLIPLDISIVELLEYFNLKVQEKSSLGISWKNKNLNFEHSIPVFLSLEKKDFSSPWIGLFTFNLENLSPNINNNTLKPINMNLDLRFVSNTYDLNLENFSFSFQNKKFWKMSGNSRDLRKKDSQINFDISESDIDFSLIEPYILSFIPSIRQLSGNLSLSPFKLTGNPETFQVDWSIIGKNILILYDKKSHSIPDLKIEISSQFSIHHNNKLTISMDSIKSLSLKLYKLIYNEISLNGEIVLQNEILEGNLLVAVPELRKLTDTASGNLEIKLDIIPSKIYNPELKLSANIKKFQTAISGENLKPSILSIELNLLPMISKSFEFLSVNMNNSHIHLFQNGKQNSVEMIVPNLKFDNIKKQLIYDNLNLKTNLSFLIEILPGNLSEKISNLRPLLGNSPEIKSDLDFQLTGKKALNSNILVFSRGDLNTDFHITIQSNLNIDGKNSIEIKKIDLKGFESKLTSKISGLLQKNISNEMIPNLELYINLESSDYISLIKNIAFLGKINTAISLKDNQIKGNFNSIESFFKFKTGICPGMGCKNFDIVNINFNIPIEHNLTLSKSDTILEGNKTEFLKNFYTKSETNFSIEKIAGSHPTLEEKTFLYANGIKREPGLNARVQYTDNKFTISNLSLNILNGSISSKSIILNLGNSHPESMEFLGNLQVRDIDLKELLAEDSRKNIDDGKIRGDINFSGKNFKDPIDNMEVFFSIYRIGKDFGKSAINVVSPPNLIRDYIVNSYSVDKIEAELSKGLVYVNILFKQGLLSNLLTKIDNNKISQERMPLNNFINRAQDEISTYNR